MHQTPKVSFTAMKEGTAADFQMISNNDKEAAKKLPQRIIDHLKLLGDDDGAYQISRLDHVLQTATRCERDGADDDWIIAALMHDIGDMLAPYTHADLAAEIIRPFVREEVYWVVKYHGYFQMHYNINLPEAKQKSREQFKDNPYYQSAIDFCENWDQCSFDPDYATLPLAHFVPLIERVFTRPPHRRSSM